MPTFSELEYAADRIKLIDELALKNAQAIIKLKEALYGTVSEADKLKIGELVHEQVTDLFPNYGGWKNRLEIGGDPIEFHNNADNDRMLANWSRG